MLKRDELQESYISIVRNSLVYAYSVFHQDLKHLGSLELKLNSSFFISATCLSTLFHSLCFLCIRTYSLEMYAAMIFSHIVLFASYLLLRKKNKKVPSYIILGIAVFSPILGVFAHSFMHYSIVSIFGSIFISLIFQNTSLMIIIGIIHLGIYNFTLRPRFIAFIQTATSLDELATNLDQQNWAINIVTFLCLFCSAIYHEGLKNARERQSKTREELEETNKKLQRTIKQQERLILSFSHELTNPLHTISGNLKEMQSKIQSTQIMPLIISTQSCIDFLLCLISNILDSSKIEQDAIDVAPVETDPFSFFFRLWESCENLISLKGLRGKLEFTGFVPVDLEFDQHRISQIVFNLVSNAIKFTEKGEIKVLVSSYPDLNEDDSILLPLRSTTQTMEVAIPDETEDQKDFGISERLLRIEVTDTGCGIAPEKIQDIFNRPLKSLEEENNGRLQLGLSLWVTKKILDKMGGKINIVSEPGKGTSVIFTVPCKVPNPCRSFSKQSIPYTKTVKLRAMVVEDGPLNAQINKTYLKKCGASVVHIASNGKEAVEFFEKEINAGRRIDLILMDIEMPHMDGKQATRLIRKMELDKSIKPCEIVFISGNCLEREINECLDKFGEIRGNYFLKKPVKLEDFIQVYKTIENRFYLTTKSNSL